MTNIDKGAEGTGQLMNKFERKHIEALERRRDYLKSLEDDGETNSWDQQEMSALRWALTKLKQDPGDAAQRLKGIGIKFH